MAFGIDGQFFLNFNFGGNSDFIGREDLVSFTIFEYPGNILPTFSLNFRTTDDSILRYLNEGNLLQAQTGRDRDNLIDIQLSPNTLKVAKDGADYIYLEVSGYASQINYITDHNLLITPLQSAIATTIQVAERNGFKVKTNINTSQDSQRWIQPNISDKAFINDTYLRAKTPNNSAVAIAITADSQFIIKDIIKDLNSRDAVNSYDYKFTKNPIGPNDYSYDADTTIESQAGLINSWLGYGREIKEINNETGVVNSILENPEVVMALSRRLDKLQDIGDRYGGSRFRSENVHEGFWSSYNHNLSFLSNLSKLENAFSVSDQFFSIRPLDVAMFVEESTELTNQSSDYKSGLYLTSGVIRSYQHNKLITTVLLNREAFNQVKTGAI